MKDCGPRDWPHLPDSRVNERPHWIIPHNAPGTKAQQLTLETARERRMKRRAELGQGSGFQTVEAHGSTLAYRTAPLQNKKTWETEISPSAPSLLRLFPAPPSLIITLSPACSRSLSQEDLKYQYPFLLDIAFSLQSAFCCPFTVKTSGETPRRNILSNAALGVSSLG